MVITRAQDIWRADTPPQGLARTGLPSSNSTPPTVADPLWVVSMPFISNRSVYGLYKHTMYRILTCGWFWDRTRMPGRMRDQFAEARVWIRQAWRRQVFAPPPLDCNEAGETVVCEGCERLDACKSRGADADADARKRAWCADFADYAAEDPQDPLREVGVVLGYLITMGDWWCADCLDERARAWEAARMRWWETLDG